MAKCDRCGATILFGGVKKGGSRFCSEACKERNYISEHASELPENALEVHEQQDNRRQLANRLRRLLTGAGFALGIVVAVVLSSNGKNPPGILTWMLGGGLGGGGGYAIAEILIRILHGPVKPPPSAADRILSRRR
jgi:predicted nucleic acid-binding Zn ribbon protein